MPLTPASIIERKTVLRILGLDLELLDGIEEMPPEHYNHRTLCKWIERSLEQNSEHVDSIDENATTAQQLAFIGFDPSSDTVKNIIERSSAATARNNTFERANWHGFLLQTNLSTTLFFFRHRRGFRLKVMKKENIFTASVVSKL